ncbi:unnamed protein product, partial [Urochloa humidicola]
PIRALVCFCVRLHPNSGGVSPSLAGGDPETTGAVGEGGHPIRKEAKLLCSDRLLPMDGAAAAAGGSGEPAANGSKSEGKQFDPSRMIGIIKRKALIKDLAAAYHAECIASCKELLQLQRKWEEEQYVEAKIPEEPRSLMMKSSKHRKK